MMLHEEDFTTPPRTCPAPGFTADGCTAIFYDGPAWRGKPTKVFAWYGLPDVPPGQKVPAIVLAHGGIGTAFDYWVRLWNTRGYAAIAMDLCGSVPRDITGHEQWQRHADGGPPGWGGFDQLDLPPQDQWPAQAVADIVRAHTLLRSFPQVDARRIGITGISWGGYLTCIAAGVDSRFAFAAPVYGCGFLQEDSAWASTFRGMGTELAAQWLAAFEPSVYLPHAAMPMLWVDGTNDLFYPMNSLQKSYRLPAGDRTLAIRVNMEHGQIAGQLPEEIHAFADAVCMHGVPLPRILDQGRTADQLWAGYESRTKIVKAELNYTLDAGKWVDRQWRTEAATVDTANHRVSATLPRNATGYLNLIDERGLLVSTEHSGAAPR